MPSFSVFDQRKYRTVSAREGYALWSASYEETIKPDMDSWLLDRVRSVRWDAVDRAGRRQRWR